MHRRSLTMLSFVAVVAFASAASCGGEESYSASKATTTARDGSAHGPVGFGAAGADAPAPAPLTPLSRSADFAAREAPARRRSDEAGVPTPPAAPGAPGQAGLVLPSQAQQPGAMLIRSGNAVVEVDSVEVGIGRVRRLAQENGALVANTTIQSGREQQRSASLELRIPSAQFDAVVNGLAPIGKVESVNISAQDVGEEFVDLSARVANARRLEQRLIELLANRTGRLSDVLTVERELARVREEIERYEGRLRYLQSRVSVSSLTVVVHEPAPVVAAHPGQNVIADAFVQAWRSFVLLVAGFISSLGVLIPLAAVGAGVFMLWRRYGGQKRMAVEQG